MLGQATRGSRAAMSRERRPGSARAESEDPDRKSDDYREPMTTDVSRWFKRAKPPTSVVRPTVPPRRRIALTCEVGGPEGPSEPTRSPAWSGIEAIAEGGDAGDHPACLRRKPLTSTTD